MLDGLSGVLGTSEKEGVASSRSTESQLIESQDLSTGGDDARTSGSGEAEGRNAEFRDGQKTVVISDGTNNHDGLVVRLLGGVRYDSGDRDRGSVDAGHKQAAEDDLVERRLGSAYGRRVRRVVTLADHGCRELTSQEAVELHEQLEIDIVTLWRLAVSVPDVVGVKIDTYSKNLIVSLWPIMLCAFRSCDTICCAGSRSLRYTSTLRSRRYVRRDSGPSLAYGGGWERTHGCGCRRCC